MNSIKFIAFASVIGCAFAAMAIGPAQVDPSNPDKCFDSEGNKFYAPGESWSLEYCGMSTCSMQNISGTPQLMVEYASCGVAVVDPPCFLKEDKSLQYPDCCPQPECPEDYSNEQQQEQEGDGKQEQEEDDFLNEIEDDEAGDSMFNHKYNSKMVDEHSIKDPAKEDDDFYKPLDSTVPSNTNQYSNDRDRYRGILGQDQFTDSEEPTLDERNAAYLKALQDELMRYYPQLWRRSPRFGYVDSSEEFKDEHFQWF